MAGISRAPTMVIAWLVRWKNIPLFDAYSFVRKRRSVVDPNPGFMLQLALYELELGKGSSVKHREEWNSYAFNMMKVDEDNVMYTRRYQGVFFTTLRLYRKQKHAENVLT